MVDVSGIIDDVRLDIGDYVKPYNISTTNLSGIVVKSTRRINRRLRLTGDEEITVTSDGRFSPALSASEADLIILQAECAIVKSNLLKDIKDGNIGIRAEDGEQILETDGKSRAYELMSGDGMSVCKELNDAIKMELLRRSSDGFRMVW